MVDNKGHQVRQIVPESIEFMAEFLPGRLFQLTEGLLRLTAALVLTDGAQNVNVIAALSDQIIHIDLHLIN